MYEELLDKLTDQNKKLKTWIKKKKKKEEKEQCRYHNSTNSVFQNGPLNPLNRYSIPTGQGQQTYGPVHNLSTGLLQSLLQQSQQSLPRVYDEIPRNRSLHDLTQRYLPQQYALPGTSRPQLQPTLIQQNFADSSPIRPMNSEQLSKSYKELSVRPAATVRSQS